VGQLGEPAERPVAVSVHGVQRPYDRVRSWAVQAVQHGGGCAWSVVRCPEPAATGRRDRQHRDEQQQQRQRDGDGIISTGHYPVRGVHGHAASASRGPPAAR